MSSFTVGEASRADHIDGLAQQLLKIRAEPARSSKLRPASKSTQQVDLAGCGRGAWRYRACPDWLPVWLPDGAPYGSDPLTGTFHRPHGPEKCPGR
jgi:hypothetical protein